MQNKRSHSFHIIDPSPWPILVSLTLFNLLMGFILYMMFHTFLQPESDLKLYIHEYDLDF